MRDKLKWAAAAAIGGVIESWGVAAFAAGVGFVTGVVNAILAYDTGLPYYQVVLVFALTFGGISAGLFLLTVPLLRYIKLRNEKQQVTDKAATEGAGTSQQLTQSGIVNNPVFAPQINIGQIENQGRNQARSKSPNQNRLTLSLRNGTTFLPTKIYVPACLWKAPQLNNTVLT